MDEIIKLLVDGGAATAGPPLGPALGPMGVNAGKVVEDINKETQDFKGMKIPVEVIIDTATKEYKIKVGTPPTSALILKAIGLEKGGGSEGVGDLPFDQALDIAKKKRDVLLSKDLTCALKEVAGACQSLKLTVDGKNPKEFIKAVNEGGYKGKIE
ncbi:50S ribosomal protein L11 [Candidatus Altiarchaeota archaeon]